MLRNTEKVYNFERLPFPEPGEGVVISGMAGRFPESDNLTLLRENLFNKVDLVTDDGRRWKFDHPEIPQRTGKVNHVDRFDAEFFGIHSMEAHMMDPMGRMLMEHAYEAIIDAGVNPRQLRGTNTGVFIGSCYSESEKSLVYTTHEVMGLGVPGCCRAMLANRISHWLGCNGPSYTTDAACSSSLFAIYHAYKAIRLGECDAALVAGCNLCLHPNLSKHSFLLGVLSSDGRCKSFDAAASGYCRSEAVSVIYLQKSKDAKRIYARVVHTKTNCDGYKEEGITFPSSAVQCTLLQQFYAECKVPPSSVAYLEAHGTGTDVGDPVEVDAVARVYCPGRTTPLRIGSVKSNLGHCESASGLCSIAKVIIAMESGYIPPNLHYMRPRKGMKALEDGRIQVITEPTPWEGGYVGINSFGFGGGNAHVLLKSNSKGKINNGRPSDNMPRLVVVSGRTEEAVTTLLDDLESRPVDVEYISLYHNIHSEDIPGHLYRGYTILPPKNLPTNKIRDVQQYGVGVKRPVWFVFSGIGSEYPCMGAALLKIPVFAKAIQKCNDVLKSHNVDITDILTAGDSKIFNNFLNSLLSTAAVQIGLVDVLASVGIVPDNIIGYSVGELGCAYADGCLTADQMILAAYFQGLALIEAETIARRSVLVNSKTNGKADSFPKINGNPKAKYISAGEDPYGNVAHHNISFNQAVRLKSLAYMQKIIPKPKPRSKKWSITSVPSHEWETNAAYSCSPEYLTNSLLKQVSFEDMSHLIPKNAITIEIAPHGLLQTALRRSYSNGNITNIALTEHGQKQSVEVLLQAIGKMYEAGLHPQLANLYPSVEYPVSRGTPMISPLIRWNHSDEWCVINYGQPTKLDSGVRDVSITLDDEAYYWMAGHVIDGRNLVPATGYLALIWETVGMLQGELYTEIPVVFQDVRFHRAITIPKEGSVDLRLMIQKGLGRFEVFEGCATVVTGFVRTVTNPVQERVDINKSTDDDEELDLTSRDVYKELRLRGYHYSGFFQGLAGVSVNGNTGRIAWKNNWVAFMDNMLQMKILGADTRSLLVPTDIRKLVIDPKMHMKQLRAMSDGDQVFRVEVHRDLDIVTTGGVEIRGFNLKASAIPLEKRSEDPVLEKLEFVAHRDRSTMELKAITRLATHIALENQFRVNIKIIELISEADDISPDELTSGLIQKIVGDLPIVQAEVKIFAPVNKFAVNALPSNIRVSDSRQLSSESGASLAVGHGLLTKNNAAALEHLKTAVDDKGFLMLREPLQPDTSIISDLAGNGFDVVLEKRTERELVILLRKIEILSEIATVIQVNNNEFSWLPKLQAALKAQNEKKSRSRSRILLVSEGHFESGLMGLVHCLRKEPGGEGVQGLLIQDSNAPKFSSKNEVYLEQLKLGLALNVLRPGKLWGSYQFFALDPFALKPVYHARIIQCTRGDLSALKWVEGTIQPTVQHNDIIQIHYSSINYRDVMLGTGKLPVEVVAKTRRAQESVIGFEFSGMDTDGRQVMGLVETGALSNLCVCDRELLWTVPDNWTLEDAATVPAAYGTAYYALHLRGRMKKGDKVLIHAGSGGVGQAAITIALHEGCEVFTTVGTPEKRKFIRNRFPQIDDDHIGSSRDTSFEQLVLRRTRGQGVDIVLSSLAEEQLQASVRCLTPGGRFLDIGKFDLAANKLLGLEPFLKGITFCGILFDNLFTASSDKKRKLVTMLDGGLKSGVIKPLARTVFPTDQVEAAFRYMATGEYIGKIVVKVRDDDDIKRQPELPLALPRFYCREECSYLILGGLGGFGLELADWLVLRGAKKLILTSRKGISNGYQRLRINLWKTYGVTVVIVAGQDASTYEGCGAILRKATALGPVDAIFNLAVVLKDALFVNQTVEKFEESFRVKARATKQLDKLSRTLCPQLRQFVVFSSVSCGRGYAGQTNYGMANSIVERICEARKAENLPGLAIEWGAIGGVGLLTEIYEDNKEVIINGTRQQKISSCLQELDGFLQQDSPVVSSMVLAAKTAGGAGAVSIVEALASIIGLKNLKTVGVHTPLAELGMDSMMAVEIKHTLEREYGVYLSAPDIRGLDFARLQEISQQQATGDKDPESIAKNARTNDNYITTNIGVTGL